MDSNYSLDRLQILFAFNQNVRDTYLDPHDIARLEAFANWTWFECEGGGIYDANQDPIVQRELQEHLAEIDGLVVCHGAPQIDAALLDAAPKLKLIGELEGDRFASRIDLEAAWQRGMTTLDTTNGSSYPVAEWALALTLVALRNAGAQFRRIIAGETSVDRDALQLAPGTLTGKCVGLIGCGHMGRRLIKLMAPFDVDVWVYDPYLPREKWLKPSDSCRHHLIMCSHSLT
ncbi:hypothetical protein KFU94_22205 [Chloroflexi bacterium TSY]|nr:hypothetical protein [Chloroflexi bacterium TSY]